MRVTDEQRKKVAAQLREYAKNDGEKADYTLSHIATTGDGLTQSMMLGLVILLAVEDVDRSEVISVLDVMDFLADCIEPRQERTCSMEYGEHLSGNWVRTVGTYECSECGYVTFDDEPNYCPHCGARVLGEGDAE